MTKKKVIILFDGDAWFVRRLGSAIHDVQFDEMIYRCDLPIANE